MTVPGIDAWRAALREADRCPWPGPRPFPEDTPEVLLVGRERDRADFKREVSSRSHRLIFLTGVSGVGKSSLLTAGLIPDLRGAGFTVALCRDWSGSDADITADAFLAAKIQEALHARGVRRPSGEGGEGPPYSSDVSLFWELQEDLGGNAVVILDQFEELLRYAPDMQADLFDLLHEINHTLEIKIVISFRHEFLLELQRLEKRARPFSFSQRVLDHVPRRDPRGVSNALNLALAPNTTHAEPVIVPAAANAIADLWDGANPPRPGPSGSDDLYGTGMLQLQALLYTLHDAAGGGRIEEDHVREWARDRDSGDVFPAALRRSIDVKLARSRAAAADVDRYLLEGATQTVARIAPHLSSADYKLEREARDLAEQALGPELTILLGTLAEGDLPEEEFAALFGTVVRGSRPGGGADRVGTTRREIAAAADRRLGRAFWAPRLLEGAPPAEADSDTATAGPAMGLSPTAVLIEELRRFAFALAWLEETSLVRLSSPGGGKLIVSLIHDRFDRALRTWARARTDEAQGALYALTAPRGAAFEWRRGRVSRSGGVAALTEDDVRVVANLRWRGAGVNARFRSVVFVNCDFRGAFFFGSAFEGVTFVNCMLEGVVFVNCTLTDHAQHEPGFSPVARPAADSGRRFAEPLFEVRGFAGADAAAVRSHLLYRGLEGEADGFVSRRPDEPALPRLTPPERDATPWTPATGGVIVYGSRVSSMVLRRCEGDLSLRHSAGSGFDVLEHRGGHFELFDSTLRHVRFTAAGDGEPLDIRATDSVLSQVWFGEDLRGEFVAEGGAVLQAWNQARRPAFEAVARGAQVYGLVGVSLERCEGLGMFDYEPGGRETVPDTDPRFFSAAQAMDHRDGGGPPPDEPRTAGVTSPQPARDIGREP